MGMCILIKVAVNDPEEAFSSVVPETEYTTNNNNPSHKSNIQEEEIIIIFKDTTPHIDM